MSTTNIILSGTGGQGIVLASRIIAQVAFQSGYDVKESEIHGMAQRGGSVISHIRFGNTVFSPQIPAGKAQIMIALEELEALRYLRFLQPQGIVILNRKKILPAMAEEKDYPQDIENLLQQKEFVVIAVEAEKIARQMGNPRIENSVILGILSALLSFKEEIWHDVISKAVPPKTVELNIKAFNEGRRLVKEDAILEQRIRNIAEAKT